MFGVYKRYPFPVPARTKFFNLFRYFFTFSLPEKFLIAQLSKGNSTWWPKFIPPIYLHKHGSVRNAQRGQVNFTLDVSNLIDHSIYFFTMNDPAWAQLLKLVKADYHVVDAGANIGYLSMNFAKLCSQGHVYSFEPDSENYRYLKKNKEDNAFQNITLFNKALGAEPGTARLFKLYENNTGANRILNQNDSATASETIEIITLDSLKQQGIIQKVDLLKIDVEGYEPFVLQGASEIIRTWHPILFIELAEVNLRQQNYTAKKLIEQVEHLGYHVLDARTMQPVDRTVKEHHTDILCFPNQQRP
jgi:FkbM family methyltransferase